MSRATSPFPLRGVPTNGSITSSPRTGSTVSPFRSRISTTASTSAPTPTSSAPVSATIPPSGTLPSETESTPFVLDFQNTKEATDAIPPASRISPSSSSSSSSSLSSSQNSTSRPQSPVLRVVGGALSQSLSSSSSSPPLPSASSITQQQERQTPESPETPVVDKVIMATEKGTPEQLPPIPTTPIPTLVAAATLATPEISNKHTSTADTDSRAFPIRTPSPSRRILRTPLSKSTPNGTKPSSSISKGKLRRKVSVQDSLADTTSVQRLVEYFVVVSSIPRWENTKNTPTPGQATKSPQRGGSSPFQPTMTCSPPSSPSPTSPEISPRDVMSPDLNLTANNKFRSRWVRLRSSRRTDNQGDANGNSQSDNDLERQPDPTNINDDEIDDDLTVDTFDTFDDETSTVQETTEKIRPPTPRNEWTREETGAETNIHLPDFSTPKPTGYEHTFQPKITSRFPSKDYEDNPLNPMIVQFCYPSGDIIVPSRTYELPRVHHFVLTNEKGRKVYGTCLTIFEEYHPSKETPWRKDQIHSDDGEHDIEVTMASKGAVLYIPRVLCLLSTWPYLTAFREYLSQFYRLATMTNIMSAPLERYIVNICLEIPAPPPGAYEVQLSILNSTIRFWAPPAKLPVAYVALPYGTLFDCLDVENILLLWSALVMEHKILLVSSQYSVLTTCSEILCSLLFPMRWCHLYVPLLPRFLCPMLDAPVPYLCGVNRENWLFAQQYISTETIVVDLDRNTVAFGEHTPGLTPAPTRKWNKLQAAVEQTAGHLFWRTRGLEEDYRSLHGRKPLSKRNLAKLQKKGGDVWKEKLQSYDNAYNLAYTPDSPNLLNDTSLEYQQSQWDRVQEAFLRFFVALLKDYRKFLNQPDSDSPGSFDKEAFILSQKPENQPFLMELCESQHFEDYTTKRVYSPGEPDVIFFDQSIDAKLNRSRLKLKKVDTPFLQSAKAHKILKKIQAVEPNTEGLFGREPYVYKTWPDTFDATLFCRPRPIPKMITAEFDRQSVLVSRLRAQYAIDESVEDVLDYYGNDCDDSPEGATFTVFFWTYSTLIGRDWQEYQKKRREQLEAEAALEQFLAPKTPENKEDKAVVVATHPGTAAEETTLLTPYAFPAIEITQDDCGATLICESCPDEGFSTLKSTLGLMTPSVKNMFRLDSAVKSMKTYGASCGFSNPNGAAGPTPNRNMSLIDFEGSYFAEYEEARAVASAQLDLAFETLASMSLRGLTTDADAYKSLMEACGRCGDTQRAIELIELIKRDGLCADGEVLSCFMSAFAHQDNDAGALIRMSPANRDSVKSPYNRESSDAYYTYLKKKLEIYEQTQADLGSSSYLSGILSSDDEVLSDYFSEGSGSSEWSECDKTVVGSTFFEWFTPSKAKQKPRKRKTKRKRRNKASASSESKPDMLVTETVEKQIILGESLLEFLYPGLKIDTGSDSCPHCSNVLTENEIVQGWLPCAFEDFTTCCPKCQHRFVPRFTVTCLSSTFQGSQGLGTPLYCEFLSPWVLRKELRRITNKNGDGDRGAGIEEMLQPDWRSGSDIRGTLWWNLIVLCGRYKLPFSFLLQGSFHNRLINPTPEKA